MSWVLTSRDLESGRIDLSPVTPKALAGATQADIAALPLGVGAGRVLLGDLFEIADGGAGTPADTVEIRGGSDRFDRVGAGLDGGTLVLHGPCGRHAGRGMTGGRLEIRGDCGPFAAAGMAGGELRIAGNAGDFLGAPLDAERHGMTGGLVLVGGDAGDRAGERMRRGTIVIDGRAGDWCAARMVAGTVAPAGGTGHRAGFGMRRGTILCGRADIPLDWRFIDGGRHELAFLALLRRRFAGLGCWLGRLPEGALSAARLTGDAAAGGLGEILILND